MERANHRKGSEVLAGKRSSLFVGEAKDGQGHEAHESGKVVEGTDDLEIGHLRDRSNADGHGSSGISLEFAEPVGCLHELE